VADSAISLAILLLIVLAIRPDRASQPRPQSQPRPSPE
jgi:hypothetical protein